MLAAWLILCSSFLGLAFAAHAYSRFTGDLAVARAVQAVHGAPVCDLYYGVSWIGYPLASAGIGFAAVALCWLLR
jgi:hypothetical protein